MLARMYVWMCVCVEGEDAKENTQPFHAGQAVG